MSTVAFLLELFSEEIPSRMQARAAADLARLFAEAASSLSPTAIETFHGPRRIALTARLSAQTEAQASLERGPREGAVEEPEERRQRSAPGRARPQVLLDAPREMVQLQGELVLRAQDLLVPGGVLAVAVADAPEATELSADDERGLDLVQHAPPQRGLVTGLGGILSAHAPAEEKPRLDIIDTHTHFYDPTRPQGVPWPAPTDELLYRPVLPEHFRAVAAPWSLRPLRSCSTTSAAWRRRLRTPFRRPASTRPS